MLKLMTMKRQAIQTLLLGLLLLLFASCQSRVEEPKLTLSTGTDTEHIAVRAEGDTLRLAFSTNLPREELQVSNISDWIDAQIEGDQLVLRVKRNSTPFERKAELILQAISQGERRQSVSVSVSQPTARFLATNTYLFAYYPAINPQGLSWFYDWNQTMLTSLEDQNDRFHAPYRLFFSREGGKREDSLLFHTNIPQQELEVTYAYDEHGEGWLHDLILRPRDSQQTGAKDYGLSARADALPSGVEQRRVRVTLSDRRHREVRTIFDYIQVGHSIAPAKVSDRSRAISARPEQYRILLKTEIPLEKLKVSAYVERVNNGQGVGAGRAETPYESYVGDDLFFYYNVGTYEPQEKLTEQFHLRQGSGGIILEGETTTAQSLLRYFSPQESHRYIVLRVSNELNDQELYLLLTLPKDYLSSLYLQLAQQPVQGLDELPEEGGTFALPLKTNVQLSDLQLLCPDFVTAPGVDYMEDSYEGVSYEYPDLYTLNDFKILPNPYRTPRRFQIKVTGFGHIKSSEYIRTLTIDCQQLGFTGTYTFSTTQTDPIECTATSDDESAKRVNYPVDLSTNLIPQQLQLQRIGRETGWVLPVWGVDNETGYVQSLSFYVENNTTGQARTVKLRIIPPSGEGLAPLEFVINQAA